MYVKDYILGYFTNLRAMDKSMKKTALYKSPDHINNFSGRGIPILDDGDTLNTYWDFK